MTDRAGTADEGACGLCERPRLVAALLALLVGLFAVEVYLLWSLG